MDESSSEQLFRKSDEKSEAITPSASQAGSQTKYRYVDLNFFKIPYWSHGFSQHLIIA